MDAISVPVEPVNPTLAKHTIKAWRGQYCGGAFDQIFNRFFKPLARQRLVVNVNGIPIPFEPSWFALDNFVLVFHRPTPVDLVVGIYDQHAECFLQAVVTLSMTERIVLGRRSKHLKDAFIRKIVASTRGALPPRFAASRRSSR